MKKLLTGMLIFFALYSVSSALGTVKVSINYFGESSTNVSVSVVDYDGPTLQYNETTIGNLSANASGIISFVVGVGDEGEWQSIDPANITGSWVLNIYLDGVLYSQMRLDQLLMEQSEGLLNMDPGGNIVPDDGTQSFGSDTQRWGDIFVGPETVHIGESGDEATISFDLANDEIVFAMNESEGLVIGPTVTVINSRLEQNIGNNNTSIGINSLSNNTSGSWNTSIGISAGRDNTTGNQNTFLGYQTGVENEGGFNNTTIGANAAFNNVNGSRNVAVGVDAIKFNEGSNNTAIGDRAGQSITTGGDNIFIGSEAGFNGSQKTDAQNSIAIGKNTYTTANNQVVLGNSSVTETQLNGLLQIDVEDVNLHSDLLNITSSIINYTDNTNIVSGDLPAASDGTIIYLYNNGSAASVLGTPTGADLVVMVRIGGTWVRIP